MRRLKLLLKPAVARMMEFASRWSNRRAGLALCYHRVGDPEADPMRELVPAIGTARFKSQLRHLRSRYRVVPASKLPEAVLERRRGQRFPVAITLDDDLPSHVNDAMPILRMFRLPATFFLCGASLDRPRVFWWERLQRAWDSGLVDQRLLGDLEAVGDPRQPPIRRAAAAIQELAPARRDALSDELDARIGPDPDHARLGRDGVARLAQAGFEVGFHTLRHDLLTTLDDAALAQAMTAGREALEKAAGTQVSMIAYPHGEADARVASAAGAAGYRFGFTALDRAVTGRSDPLRLDRLYPVMGTQAEFAFDLARTLWNADRN